LVGGRRCGSIGSSGGGGFRRRGVEEIADDIFATGESTIEFAFDLVGSGAPCVAKNVGLDAELGALLIEASDGSESGFGGFASGFEALEMRGELRGLGGKVIEDGEPLAQGVDL